MHLAIFNSDDETIIFPVENDLVKIEEIDGYLDYFGIAGNGKRKIDDFDIKFVTLRPGSVIRIKAHKMVEFNKMSRISPMEHVPVAPMGDVIEKEV